MANYDITGPSESLRMSDQTPRTDFLSRSHDMGDLSESVWELARQLERDLARVTQERDKWRVSHDFYGFRPLFLSGQMCSLCGKSHSTYAESHECAVYSANAWKARAETAEAKLAAIEQGEK